MNIAIDSRAQSAGNVKIILRRGGAGLIVAALLVALLRYPVAPMALALGLMAYAILLYRNFRLWLIVIPALVPIFDLAPWSGWFFLDELDLVVLLTLAVGLCSNDVSSTEVRPVPRLLFWSTALLALSYGTSMIMGVVPLEPLDANAFSNYYSRYNSLRMAKGFFEALALFSLFHREFHGAGAQARYLAGGMVLGLAATSVAVIWERFRFSGLWEFAGDFRVTATFSGLHNGGNDLEAYLVLAQPFIVASMMLRRHWLAGAGGISLFLLSTYSLFVTFSRAGLLGIGVNGALVALGLVVSLRHRRAWLNLRALAVGAVLLGVVVLLISVIVGGRYFQARLDRAKKDWDYRMTQSQKTIAMMTPGWSTGFLGMGLGRFPATVYERNPLGNRPAAYRFESEQGNLFLRLYPGNRLYFGQWIGAILPFDKYQLSFDVRAHGRGTLSAYLCEKTLQYSFRCANRAFALAETGAWEESKAEIDAGLVGANDGMGGWFSRRPVEFALANGSKDAVFDVDNIRLLDAAGNNRIVNGNFSGGSDRWYFTVDDHTPWQNWHHWVHLYFEQGWLGVISFCLFTTCLIGRLVRQVVDGNWLAAIALAAVSSFLTVGIFGYLFDTPRMALIYFLIALIFGRGLSVENGSERYSAEA